MVFELVQSTEKRWQRLRGCRLLGNVITGVMFVNGEERNAEAEAIPDREAA